MPFRFRMVSKLQGSMCPTILAILFLPLCVIDTRVEAQFNPHFVQNRTTIVHLFEWRWDDIAKECERFLGPYGYAGVQTSPPNENVIAMEGEMKRPWWERYQPVSYKLETRSGNEEEFKSMVNRCNAVGVRIYIDAVINHMTGTWQPGITGTGGSSFDSRSQSYPAVPFTSVDFNGPSQCSTSSGNIENYQDVNQIRNCKLSGLNDLNHSKKNVQDKITEIDASKHMWPMDMKPILDRLNPLPTKAGFPANARPFIFQEVIDLGSEPIKAADYAINGRVTEFKVCGEIGRVFRRQGQMLKYVKNWGEGWGLMPSGKALVFVDNHDNQRGHGAGGENILTFRTSRLYKMAQAFTLAWPYGVTRVMSSFNWQQNLVNGKDKNDWIGPPHDSNFNILPVTVNSDLTCGNGWICEHRWRQIYNMVKFRNVVEGTTVTDWWDNEKNQIAFSRGDRGFIAINNDDSALKARIKTPMPAGQYCDIISGNLINGNCTGKVIKVCKGGLAHVDISNTEEDPLIAIHAQSKL